MIEGVDYSTARPSPTGLYAAGKRFAVRYGGMGTADKWLTANERDALHGAGIAIVANVEGTTRGLIGGTKAGVQWAAAADVHFRSLGMPYDRPIYLSVDWDIQPAEWPTVRAALDGAASILGRNRVGIYGGRRAIEWAQQDHAATWFWQTYAWSGSPTTWVPGVHLQQYRNSVEIAGGNCDLDRAMTVDFGQWKAGGAVTNLGYSDVDGQFLCERVSALLHLNPATMGPENGQHFEAVELLKRVDANTAAPRPVSLTDTDLLRLAAALRPVVEDVVVDVLGRLGVIVHPRV